MCEGLKCTICGEKLPPSSTVTLDGHQCYIQPCTGDDQLDEKLIFYDFESLVGQNDVHVPFLVCAKTLTGAELSAYGLDCVRQFLLHFRRPCYRGDTFIAHNGRGYNSYLILNVVWQLGIKPSLITQGSKILCFTDCDFGLKFIDSLSMMPKALGFSDHTKGFFPHRFSSKLNFKYVGPFPSPSYYSVELISPSEQGEFYSWYREACKGAFNFHEQSLLYCKNDVDILFRGCVKFREQFFNETHVDPPKMHHNRIGLYEGFYYQLSSA